MDFARLDMGWPESMIAVEYDGDHHWTNRRQLAWDIRRTELLRELGWIVVRVTAEHRRQHHRLGRGRIRIAEVKPLRKNPGHFSRGFTSADEARRSVRTRLPG